jgi:hypothetical protein
MRKNFGLASCYHVVSDISFRFTTGSRSPWSGMNPPFKYDYIWVILFGWKICQLKSTWARFRPYEITHWVHDLLPSRRQGPLLGKWNHKFNTLRSYNVYHITLLSTILDEIVQRRGSNSLILVRIAHSTIFGIDPCSASYDVTVLSVSVLLGLSWQRPIQHLIRLDCHPGTLLIWVARAKSD